MSQEESHALLLKIAALRPSLSRAEQRVADYICQNPGEVIRLSVAGLAEASGVSDATVIRMARHIGLNGYQDLKIVLAQDLVSPLQSIHEEISENDSTLAIIDKVFQGALHTLNFTREVINPNDIERAVDAITKAQTIAILGSGNSAPCAMDFQHKLMRLGIRAYAYSDPHLAAIAVTDLNERDVVIAISHSGSSRNIVDCARRAKLKGITTISLSSLGTSPLSKIADIPLYTASKETKYRIVSLNSRIAQMAIIDSIYTIIAARNEDIVENFHNIEDALKNMKY